MEKSKVYFTDMRAGADNNLLQKLERLIRTAGIGNIDFEKKYTAIKIHFGEPGNLSFLRPNFSKTVADVVKSLGGKPFLTDCNTLYVGRRKDALEHIEAAYENGYGPFSTGCQIIIGDGLKGTDDVDVPVEGGEYVQMAHIGRAVMDADVLIALSHFKGHEATGFGGAVKNVGMGCGSRAGKMDMHCGGKPEVYTDGCRMCGKCAKICAQNAITYDANKKAHIDHEHCVGCGRCIGICNFDAIHNPTGCSNDELNYRIAEYTKAVVHGRPAFYINIVNQVSPCCDCHAENDAAIIPDVGMFASFDPIALDTACADACNQMPPIPQSALGEALAAGHNHHDHFTNDYPVTNWKSCMQHGEKIGLGTQAYELIVCK